MEEPTHDAKAAEAGSEQPKELAEQPVKVTADPATCDDALLTAVDQIDYSQYESPGLRDAIESILSVPGTLRFFLRIVFLTYPLCEVLIVWFLRDKGWVTLTSAALLGLIASLVISVLLATTLSIRRVLRETVKVVDKTLEIVGQVIADIGATGDEGIVATSAKVFGGVSRNLVLPIVENVVKAQLGFFGRPLLWIYRRVFVKTVDTVTNRIMVAASRIPIPSRDKIDDVSDGASGRLKSGADTADWLLSVIRPYLVGTSRWLTLGLLLPAWMLLGVALALVAGAVWLAVKYA